MPSSGIRPEEGPSSGELDPFVQLEPRGLTLREQASQQAAQNTLLLTLLLWVSDENVHVSRVALASAIAGRGLGQCRLKVAAACSSPSK